MSLSPCCTAVKGTLTRGSTDELPSLDFLSLSLHTEHLVFVYYVHCLSYLFFVSLPGFPSSNSYPMPPPPASMTVCPLPPTDLPLSPCPGIPLHWGIEPSQNQVFLLLLMTDKAILCYICSWSHGFLHVYSLVGGLVPGSSAGV